MCTMASGRTPRPRAYGVDAMPRLTKWIRARDPSGRTRGNQYCILERVNELGFMSYVVLERGQTKAKWDNVVATYQTRDLAFRKLSEILGVTYV